jgi:membrane associated rhomboid family serine protease
MGPIEARLTPTIKALVITNATLFSFYIFVRAARPLLAHLALGPTVLREPWQLVTSLFVEFQFLPFVFNLIGLWFVGALVERAVGTRRFLALFFTAGVLANVAIAFVGRALGTMDASTGCSLAILALFVAEGRLLGRTLLSITPSLQFQARHVAMFWVVWSVVACLLQGSFAALAGVVVTTATGYFMAGPGGWRELTETFRARRQRRRYKVLDGGVPGRAKGRSQKYWN